MQKPAMWVKEYMISSALSGGSFSDGESDREIGRK